MFNFDLKRTAIYQAVKWEGTLLFRFTSQLRKIFSYFFLISLFLFLYGFLFENFPPEINRKLLGSSLIFLSSWGICFVKETFLNLKLKKPKLKIKIKKALDAKEKYNLAEFLSFKAAKAIAKAINFAKKKKLPHVNSSILFYFLLKDNKELRFIFDRALLDFKGIQKILKYYFRVLEKSPKKEKRGKVEYSNDLQDTIFEALKIAVRRKNQRIKVGDLLIALSHHESTFKKILTDAKLKSKDIENLVWWLEDLEEKIRESRRFWEWKNLVKRGRLAKEWTAGYTPTLDKFSTDLTELVKKQGFPEIIGHQKEIEALERILAGQEVNNALIVGEPGSGRKSMVLALAEKTTIGESLPSINYKRIVLLNLVSLISQIKNIEDLESILDIIFSETVSAGNVILVIDKLDNFVGELPRPGAVDISGILVSYLQSPQFQMIGITDYSGLHKNIETNSQLVSLFDKVEVSEISKRETLMLLEARTLILERKKKIFISYPALRDIINYCDKYLPAIPFPEKALDLLDEIITYASQKRKKIVLPEDVARVVSEKIEIPVGEIEAKEKEILLNLEKLIHQRIINQDEAVNEVATALRRARAQVKTRKGPMGSFLFLGPTGVGKTETSKALAEIYFGSEEKMIRLDMSEFQAVEDISRLIGSEGEEGLLTTKIRETPFSLILLDEIEKAHPNILNLFLQVLDEGHITDGMGRKVDFKNSIIIATSNAGYKVILEAIKEKVEWNKVKQRLLDYLFKESIFRPEFINRFDAFVVFRPLSYRNLLDICQLMLQKLKRNLKERDIEFIITEPLKEKIVELSYKPEFGAREMQRVIQDKIENVLAEALLSGKLRRGNRVEIEAESFELIIS